MKNVPFKLQKGKNGGVEVNMNGGVENSEEVSAMILAKIKSDVEAKLGEKSNRGHNHCACVLQRCSA